jgi:hypothetical protein
LIIRNAFATQPIVFQTAGTIERMRITNGGYVGIGTPYPFSPLHIMGSSIANNMSWKKGITLSDRACIYFDGGTLRSLFMGHPSILGDNFYIGSATNLYPDSPVEYSFSIYTNTPLNSNPLNSARFYKNLLVSQVESINVATDNERKMGINTLDPQNVLEINTASSSAIPGNSGLRFSDLRSTSTPSAINPGSGVLALDANGNVIYVQNGTGSGYVACSDPSPSAGQLPSDSKINLNDKNFFFTDFSPNINYSKNKVAIGYNCSDNLLAKFNVKQSHNHNAHINTIGANFINNDIGSELSLTFYGVYSEAIGLQSPNLRNSNIAGYFNATNGSINKAVVGNITIPNAFTSGLFSINRGAEFKVSGKGSNNVGSYSYVVNATHTNIGTQSEVYSTNSETQNNYGGLFVASNAASINYGIKASASGPFTSTVRAGYFSGLVEATNVPIPSDIMFKDNVVSEKNALEKISKLHPVSYKMKTTDFPQFHFSENLHHGFIIQELEQYLPELVYQSVHPGTIDSLGNEIVAPLSYKSLDYMGVISINTQAINELNQKVDKQTLSDQVLKTNIQPLTNSLEKVLAMNGISYDWNYTSYPEMSFDSSNHIGFKAQEINQIDERLTYLDANDLMHVEYDKVVPLVVESIQEMNEIIEQKDSLINALNEKVNALNTQVLDQNTRLSQIESCLASLGICEVNQSAIQRTSDELQQQMINKIQVNLSNKNSIVLKQNVPNPYSESTVIEYIIPISVQKAQIQFFDSFGKLIHSVDLVARGKGELTVFANDLSSGLYTYTLVADGKVVTSKKMVKE